MVKTKGQTEDQRNLDQKISLEGERGKDVVLRVGVQMELFDQLYHRSKLKTELTSKNLNLPFHEF